MAYLRSARFSELFGVAFAVGLAFDAALFVLGLLIAVVSPGFFHTTSGGHQVAASSLPQALGILVLLVIFALVANLLVSSAGAGLLILARSIGLLGKPKAAI